MDKTSYRLKYFWSKEIIYELLSSFILVFFYFLLIEHQLQFFAGFQTGFASLLYGLLFFILFLFMWRKTKIEVLPVISFVVFLKKNNFTRFLSRLTGQFIGALLAAILHFGIKGSSVDAELNLYAEPLHPFLTGLFTGIISQIIYFLYVLINRWKTNDLIKCILFSAGLGGVFALSTVIGSITLMNPFGLLFHYLFMNNTITFKILLTGIIVHALIPMIIIAGTHLSLKELMYRKKYINY